MNRLIAALAPVALAFALAACSGEANAEDNAIPNGPSDPNALPIAAKDLKFSVDTLAAPANKAFTITFDNRDGAPHNVAIYRDSSAASKIFGQDPFGGPKAVTYDIAPIAQGTYFFRCDIHTDMNGMLEVR